MDFNALFKDKNHQVLQTLVIYDSSSLISDPDHFQKPNFGRHLVQFMFHAHKHKNYLQYVNLLCSEFVRAHRNAVDELHSTPQAMELHALVHVHHAVGGRRPAPHPVIQEAADAR